MTPKAFALLLSYVELGDSHELPHSTLKTVNEMLLALYPPKSEQISTSLEIIRALRLVISGARGSAAAVVLEELQPGICVWMEDESEVLLDSEYNNSVSRRPSAEPLAYTHFCTDDTALHRFSGSSSYRFPVSSNPREIHIDYRLLFRPHTCACLWPFDFRRVLEGDVSRARMHFCLMSRAYQALLEGI
jgi:hypothetical protein